MTILRNSIVRTLAALLGLLVFSGDVLDDVVDVTPRTVTAKASNSSDQQKSGSPKMGTSAHSDTAILNSPFLGLMPAFAAAFRYPDVDEDAPRGAPPSIDHPPQLA